MPTRNRFAILRGLGAVGVLLASSAALGSSFKFSDQDVDEIIGEVQKPDVTVVIARENLNKSYNLELEESFLDRIVRAVERPPF